MLLHKNGQRFLLRKPIFGNLTPYNIKKKEKEKYEFRSNKTITTSQTTLMTRFQNPKTDVDIHPEKYESASAEDSKEHVLFLYVILQLLKLFFFFLIKLIVV